MPETIAQDPSINYIIVVLGTVLLTKGFDFLMSKLGSSKEIQIAQINKDVDNIDNVRKDLEEAYKKIKELEEQLSLSNEERSNYYNTLEQLEFVLKLLCRQLIRRLKDDPDSLSLVNEVSNYIESISVKKR